tara:strand:+ start:410 stop:664 length:255 start_codon:yes stop_codon:yes gene_type:complete
MKLEGDKVVDHIGTVLGEYIRGEWHTKDPSVLEFIMNQGKPETVADVVEQERVRARNERGHYIKDDPSTPDVNEAWTTKTKGKS